MNNITRIWDTLQTLKEELYLFISKVSTHRASLAECTILKFMNIYFEKMMDTKFTSILPKNTTFLQPDVHFLNPYLPDAILKNVYIPFDQTDDNNYKSLGVKLEPMHYFNDPSFENDGIESLYRLLKVLILDQKITKTWWQTEISKRVFETQLLNLHIKKSLFSARFPALKFDFQAGVVVVNDDEREDDHEQELLLEDTEVKCDKLAMADIDDSVTSFEEHDMEGIVLMMKVDGIRKLKQILKVFYTNRFKCWKSIGIYLRRN